jgi:hypothetical protein
VSLLGIIRHQPLQPQKGAKLLQTTTVGHTTPTANVTATCQFDSTVRNYGGFTFETVGGFLTGIIVPEKGLYRIKGALGILANSQSILVQPTVNASASLPDGSQGGHYIGALATNGAYVVILPYSVEVELAKGDTVRQGYTQATGPIVSQSAFTWLDVTKLEEPLS